VFLHEPSGFPARVPLQVCYHPASVQSFPPFLLSLFPISPGRCAVLNRVFLGGCCLCLRFPPAVTPTLKVRRVHFFCVLPSLYLFRLVSFPFFFQDCIFFYDILSPVQVVPLSNRTFFSVLYPPFLAQEVRPVFFFSLTLLGNCNPSVGFPPFLRTAYFLGVTSPHPPFAGFLRLATTFRVFPESLIDGNGLLSVSFFRLKIWGGAFSGRVAPPSSLPDTLFFPLHP